MTLDEAVELLRREWRNDPRLREAIQIVGERAKQETIDEARARMLTRVNARDIPALEKLSKKSSKALLCPCCGRYSGVYRRPLYSTPAWSLVVLVRLWNNRQADWIHRSKIIEYIVDQNPELGKKLLRRDGDFSKLRWWGLTEQRDNDGNKKKFHSGFWRPTQHGIDFAYKKVTILSHCFHYGPTPLAFTGEHVTIDDVLGEGFDRESVLRINGK